MNNDFIYLDNNSTTQMDDRVLEAMLPFLKESYANANSGHQAGILVNRAVENSRRLVAELINADDKEIIFTSGATESINIALKGISLNPKNTKRHIITLQTEHKAVLDTCKHLETIGFEVDYLAVNADGLLDIDKLNDAIREDTFLVCIMWVNNETGVIQPIKEIADITRSNKVLFMSDATQAIGKIPINIVEYKIDVLCFSAHKFYGPKGVGALFISSETNLKKVIVPLQHGGGHEDGLRSGTLNVPAIIGFGKACEIASKEMAQNTIYIRALRDLLETKLLKIKGAFVNGSKKTRLYNTINICLPNFDANVFIGKNKNIALSNGSACTSALVEPSHVLTAMGLNEKDSLGSLRISIGCKNIKTEVDKLTEVIQFECKSGSNLL